MLAMAKEVPLTGLAKGLITVSMATLIGVAGVVPSAHAGEADAKRLLKAMSDYMAAQKAISFNYDTILEYVTTDGQKLALASSGSVTRMGSDKLRVTRTGGFADIEILFDGKTLTLLGRTENLYAQIEAPGTVDRPIDTLRVKHGRPLPGADLLQSNVYDNLMSGVIDVKDLGSGVINGIECDHLAFRTPDLDWQIWIAQGATPFPCRYVITTKTVAMAPQYAVTLRDWRVGAAVGAQEFNFKNTTGAKQIDLAALPSLDELPNVLAVGGKK